MKPAVELDRTPAAAPSNTSVAFGAAITIRGKIFSKDDLFLNGEVDGTIEAVSATVTIGPNAKLIANIKALKVVVQGSVEGNIDAVERIELRKESKVIGDLTTARIVIDDGALFKGSVAMRTQTGAVTT